MSKSKCNKTLRLILFYLLSCTWGILTTLSGAIVALVLTLTGHKPKKFGSCWCFPMTDNWGLELGLFFITNKKMSKSLCCHEVGHQLQTCMFGPLQIFLVTIPSAIRYNLRNIKTYEKKRKFSMWFGVISFTITLAMIIAHVFLNQLWFSILTLFLIVYLSSLSIWVNTESEQYEKIPYPMYDDVWFEGDATKRGIEFIGKYYPDEI